MYLSAFGVGFSEKIERSEEIKDMVAHLTGYPDGKVPEMLKLDTPLAPLFIPREDLFSKGFALPRPKERTRFKDNVVNYMRELFEEGLNKKKKVSAHEAMLRMRKEKNGNKLQFASSEWLTEQQVKSLFSRFSAKTKKGQALTVKRIEEVTEAEEEEQANLDSARAMASITADIIDNIEDDIPDTDHPLMVGEISLCDLSKSLKIDISCFRKVKSGEIKKL